MIKNSIKFTLLGLATFALATTPMLANDPPENSKGKAPKETAESSPGSNTNRVTRFRGTLDAKTDTSITVGQRTFAVNAETKFVKDGKPATLADGEVGKPVGGSYREHEGKLVAKMIRFGPVPEKAPGQAPKKEKQSE